MGWPVAMMWTMMMIDYDNTDGEIDIKWQRGMPDEEGAPRSFCCEVFFENCQTLKVAGVFCWWETGSDWISCGATETNSGDWLLCPTATGGSRTRWQTIAGSGQADETPSQVQDQAPLFKNIVNKRRCPVQLAKGKCVSSELHRLQSELHVLGAFATTCCSAARLPICWHHQLQIFSAVSCFFYLLHRSQLHIQLLIDSSAETFF